jgi:hypothetical protein
VKQKPSIEIRKEHSKRECRIPVCDGLTSRFIGNDLKKFPTQGEDCEEQIDWSENTLGAYGNVALIVGVRNYNSRIVAAPLNLLLNSMR